MTLVEEIENFAKTYKRLVRFIHTFDFEEWYFVSKIDLTYYDKKLF